MAFSRIIFIVFSQEKYMTMNWIHEPVIKQGQ